MTTFAPSRHKVRTKLFVQDHHEATRNTFCVTTTFTIIVWERSKYFLGLKCPQSAPPTPGLVYLLQHGYKHENIRQQSLVKFQLELEHALITGELADAQACQKSDYLVLENLQEEERRLAKQAELDREQVGVTAVQTFTLFELAL